MLLPLKPLFYCLFCPQLEPSFSDSEGWKARWFWCFFEWPLQRTKLSGAKQSQTLQNCCLFTLKCWICKSCLSGHHDSLYLHSNFRQMAKKGNRVQVILECTEHKDSGKPGTSRYITTKNRKNSPDRIELKKYNPVLRKMTVHKEIK